MDMTDTPNSLDNLKKQAGELMDRAQDALDRDKDGNVELEDIKAHAAAAYEAAKNALDRDKDGKVGLADIRDSADNAYDNAAAKTPPLNRTDDDLVRADDLDPDKV